MTVSGLGSSLAYQLSRAERSVNRGLAAALAGEDLTVEQWRIMRALADGRGESMGELAEAVLMPHPTLTKAVDRLIDRALVYRGPAKGDRRRVAVFVSERGAELLARVDGAVAEQQAVIAGVFGRERTALLMRDLESLVRALDETDLKV
ncbi:MarR family transcriptional regulator [Nonomuraea terrae]|uniref:MarR family transcriptional regulator n=1 Tax=Nonomuraea terrae TaxID=2530383 RepID=A0A4R4Z088_9ACTN|nr:MarR family transcriptional regulator [Nonomuraea terrae]TDD51288.1 MarR family transcriptional regulator [Nonomuraea terrae]